jgi:ferredoxin
MADLTRTALDLSEKREVSVVVPPRAGDIQPERSAATAAPNAGSPPAETQHAASATPHETAAPPQEPEVPIAPAQEVSVSAPLLLTIEEPPVDPEPEPAPVPEAMLRVQKCTSCGFPVSEGRSLCVDCASKQPHQSGSAELMPAEDVPSFLSSQKPVDESWLANHVNLLAVLVLVLSIVVAVVVFR